MCARGWGLCYMLYTDQEKCLLRSTAHRISYTKYTMHSTGESDCLSLRSQVSGALSVSVSVSGAHSISISMLQRRRREPEKTCFRSTARHGTAAAGSAGSRRADADARTVLCRHSAPTARTGPGPAVPPTGTAGRRSLSRTPTVPERPSSFRAAAAPLPLPHPFPFVAGAPYAV